jgi:hypothetical protein
MNLIYLIITLILVSFPLLHNSIILLYLLIILLFLLIQSEYYDFDLIDCFRSNKKKLKFSNTEHFNNLDNNDISNNNNFNIVNDNKDDLNYDINEPFDFIPDDDDDEIIDGGTDKLITPVVEDNTPSEFNNVLNNITATSLNDEYNIINNTITMVKSQQDLINDSLNETLDPEEELFNMKTKRDYSNYDINLEAILTNHSNYRDMLKNN